jgi:hypothetical protein
MHTLTHTHTHTHTRSGDVILPTDIVEEVLSAHDDVYIRPGPAPTTASTARRRTAAGAAARGAAAEATGTCVGKHILCMARVGGTVDVGDS